MVPLMSLWIPIVLSAVIVFVASSAIHMFLTYHKGDFGQVPSEDGVREALRGANIPPGDYVIPYAGSAKAMGEPEFIEKATESTNAFLTVIPNGVPKMGASLAQWFVYCIVVGIFAAYVAGHARRAGGRISARVPVRGDHRIRGICAGTAPELDLVPPKLGRDPQVDVRRAGVRTPDCRHVRMAMALLRARRPSGGSRTSVTRH